MSRSYRIDIEMLVGQAYDDFNEEQFKLEIFPYFCCPDLDPDDPDAKEWAEEIADGFENFDHHASELGGAPRTSIHVSRVTNFCGVYTEKQYREDVLQQITRFKKELPFQFSVEIQVHYLEHDPAIIISEGNL